MSGEDVLTSKADRIYHWILDEFHSGRIAAGDRLPSENELCAIFSVSRPQARMAVARLAHEGLVKTIRGTGTFRLDPREGARGFYNRDIAVVLPHLDSYIYPEIVASAGSVLRGHGYQALFDCSDSDAETELHILERLLDRRPAGLIFSPLQHTPEEISPSLPLVRRLRAAGAAVVLVDNTLGEEGSASIRLDDFGAGAAAADYLFQRGHRRLAVCWQTTHAPFHNRARGFLEAAAGLLHGIPDHVKPGTEGPDIGTGGSISELRLSGGTGAGQSMESFIRGLAPRSKGPWAVFCANDRLALDLREAAAAEGLRIPEDISIMGFDDSPIARVPEIALTTFAYPSRWIGGKAAETVIWAVETARAATADAAAHRTGAAPAGIAAAPAYRTSIVVEPVLIERGSVSYGPAAEPAKSAASAPTATAAATLLPTTTPAPT